MSKPQLRFSETRNGYWCEYLSGDWSTTGVSGFSQESPELAEKNMWEVLRKIRKAQLEVKPMALMPKKLNEEDYPLTPITNPHSQERNND